MTKIQKTWLGVSLGLFLLPEILFSFLISSGFFLFSGTNFPSLLAELFGEQFFIDHKSYLFLALIVEIIGITGLLSFNAKFNTSKYKLVISILLFILLLFGILVLQTAYSIRNGIGF